MQNAAALERIVKVVNDNSGGVKFIDLITELMTTYRSEFEPITDDFADQIEAIIRNSNCLKILDYTYLVLNRSKMFVYTP